MLCTLVLLAQIQLPPPIGYVSDFAGVVDAASAQRMLAIAMRVQRASGGEIVVVTLPTLRDRPAVEVARDIGRAWRVGAQGGPGDKARNAGVVLLLKPGEHPGDGKAEVAIGTGSGAEGFITDAFSGRIRDSIAAAAVRAGSYGPGLLRGVEMLGNAYAREFNFDFGAEPVSQPAAPAGPPAQGMYLALVVLLFVVPAVLRLVFVATAFRRPYYRSGLGGLGWFVLGSILSGGRRRGAWGGGGWRGGGFGGGGFGGFGGGGGFSGGGASGRF